MADAIRVLLIEDSDVEARVVGAALSAGQGAVVRRARSLAEMRSARGETFDLVVVDLGLPDSDGLASYAAARAAFPEASVIVLSSQSDPGVALAAMRDGADDYLVKGDIAPAQVARAVAHALERRALAERRQRELKELATASRLAAIARLAGGAVSEIGVPLEYARAQHVEVMRAIETLAWSASGAPAGDPRLAAGAEATHAACVALKHAAEGLALIDEILSSLRAFAQVPVGVKSEYHLNAAVAHAVRLTAHEWKPVARVTTRLDFSLPPLFCDASGINHVLIALLVNAAEAFARAGRTDGTISVSTADRGAYAELQVRDDGPGVPLELRGRLFEPFASSKPVGMGGMGLAVARAVVERHTGEIAVDTGSAGTTVTAKLPYS